MRRALLIGCQTNGLTGVENDLVRFDAALALHGFARRALTGEGASRDAILAVLREFIAATEPGDAALLYYSGHGGRVENPRHAAPRDGSPAPRLPEPRRFQYIVPTDHSPQEFRGIFSAELTALIADLTMKTNNVTVVLDCCHATGLPLDPGFVHKAVPVPWAGDVSAHLEWLRAQGYDLSSRAIDVEGNPNAVRLVACAAKQIAYEFTAPDGERGGLFTWVLAQLLREASEGPAPSWEAIGHAARARVSAIMNGQHPDVLGPRHRRIFTVDEADRLEAFAYDFVDGRHQIRGGSLHGIHRGDRFLVMPLNAIAPDRDLALAELEADSVDTLTTTVRLAPLAGRPAVDPGARAIRVDVVHRAHPVRVDAGGDLQALLYTAIAASPRLLVADDAEPAIATVTVTAAGALELRDHLDALVFRHRNAAGLAREPVLVIRLLEQLARVRELLSLASGTGESGLEAPEVVWGRLTAAGTKQLPSAGATVRSDDRLYFTIRNTGSRLIRVSVLGVGVDRSIALRSKSEPQGVLLAPDRPPHVLGNSPAGELLGLALDWPEHVPRSEPQPIAFVVVATDLPVDLRSLECEVHDIGELLALVGESPIYLANAPPTARRVCRLAVVHLSAHAIFVAPPPDNLSLLSDHA